MIDHSTETRARRSAGPLGVAALAAALATGCTSATIQLEDGPPIDGEIVRSDARQLVVRTGQGDIEIERSRIADIDHPGNVAMVVGGVMLGISSAMITVPLIAPSGRDEVDRVGDLVLVSTGIIYAVGGLVPLISGGASWIGSRRRAGGSAEPATSAVTLLPAGVHVRF